MSSNIVEIAKHPLTVSVGTSIAFVAMPAFESHVESQKISNADFKRFELINSVRK